MMNYYNEWDKGAAAWLRELIKAGLIPNGYVDERSITEVTPSDLEGFTQCHFFAGIGGWSLALKLAGVPASSRLWTGSPPCQPFSVAGQSLGFDDERHLAPAFLRLIRECKPQLLFGEQVAAAIGKHWLDFVFLNLEEKGYTCGAAVLPACSVGAPHKRDRLFFGASLRLGDTKSERQRTDETGQHRGTGQQLEGAEQGQYDKYGCANGDMANPLCEQRDGGGNVRQGWRDEPANGSICGGLADTDDTRPQGRERVPERGIKLTAGSCGVADELANCDDDRQQSGAGGSGSGEPSSTRYNPRWSGETVTTNPNHGFWSDADWLGCRDGKFRPVEPGTFPLANGIPARVGRLRGYGNAIVPQAAAEFIKAFLIN